MTQAVETVLDRDPVAPSVGFARLTRDSALYALGSVAGKVIGLVMLPILTRFLVPAEYGRVDLLTTMGSAAISALLLGLDVAVVRLALDPGTLPDVRRRLFGSWVAIGTGLAVVPALVLIAWSGPVSVALFGTTDLQVGVIGVGLVTIFGTYQVMTLTILRTQGRAFAYTVVSAGTLALNAVIAVVLLTTWRRDSAAVVYALAASLLLGALLGIGLAGRSVLGRPSMPLARNLVRLGLPLAPAVAATWLAEFANRAILLDRAGAEQLGYLSVALRFGSIAGLAVVGFQLAWQPLAFSLGTGREALERIGLDARRILVVVSMVVVVVAAGSREGIALLSGPGYAGALGVVGLALVGQLFTAVFLVASMPSALARSMGHLGIAGIAGVGAAVAVNLVVAGPHGAQGTATALAIGPLVSAATAWTLGRTRLRMPIAGAAIALVVASAAVFAIVVTTVDAFASPWLRMIALLAFAGILAIEGTAAEIIRYVRGRLAR